MERELDFLDLEGAASPKMVAKLRKIPGLADPELLARLIDGHAGFDFDARLFGLEAERRDVRATLRPLLEQLRATALEIVRLTQRDRDIWPSELAAADLLHGANWTDLTLAQHSLEAIDHLSSVPIQPDDRQFGGGQELDRPATRVVTAVADYCARVKIAFTGGPRRQQTDRGPVYIAKSVAAKLVEAVLIALEVPYEPQELATHMLKARTLVGARQSQAAA